MAADSQGSGQFKRQIGQLIEAQVARRQAGLSGKDARSVDVVTTCQPAAANSCARRNMAVVLPPAPVKLTSSRGGNSQGHMEIHRCVLPFIVSDPVSDALLRMASRTPPATASDFSEMVKQ